MSECILNKTLIKKFTNDHGMARIIPEWDTQATRNCPTCGGVRYLETHNPQGYRMMTPCAGMYTLERIDTFNRARVPARFMYASFDNYQNPTATVSTFKKNIEEYQKGAQKPGILLEGGPGSGKTHLLCAAIRYLTLEQGIPCLYVDYSNLLSDIRSSYAQNISEATHIEPLARIPVLFLDELGKGRDQKNDFEIRIIDEIINRRYLDPNLTTFFASNYRDRSSSGYKLFFDAGYGYSQEQWIQYAKLNFSTKGFSNLNDFLVHVDRIMRSDHIEDRVSERTASRILEMAVPKFIEAKDYRKKVDK